MLNGNKIAVFRVYISRAKGEEKLNVVKRRERRRFPYRSTALEKNKIIVINLYLFIYPQGRARIRLYLIYYILLVQYFL